MDTRSLSTSSSSRPLHVVICPWLAFGHLLPFLDLAERLASRGHQATFVSTPRNIARLQPARLPQAAVRFVALPLPHIDGLPDGTESTHDLPEDKVDLLWKAFDGLAIPFADFLSAACAASVDDALRPDCIIFDIFHYWAAVAAREHKVPGVMFQQLSAHNVAAWNRRLPAKDDDVAATHERATSGMSAEQRRSMTLELCTLTAMRSCQEWEPELVPFVTTLGGKPVVPFGLMPPRMDQGCRRRTVNGEITDTDGNVNLRWLDAQPANSVVYIALGSEVPLSVEQVHELSLGLELAGTRFLWALRKPHGISGEEDVLPPGFQERTCGRGVVTFGWVPQISILAHGAIGAFLTHCGWSSTIEGLLLGHPLIMLPIVWDQWPNARLMEGKKVGVQVPRDDKDRSMFSRHGVASAVQVVMMEEESRRVFVANAKKLQAIASDRETQERYIDGFIQQLTSYMEH